MRFTPTLRAASLTALVVFLGCRAGGEPAPASGGDGITTAAAPREFAVTQRHEALDAPSFVWLTRSDWPTFESPDVAAREIAVAVAPTFHLQTDAQRATLAAPVLHDTGRGGIIARYAQRLDGVEVFRGSLNVVMSRALEPVAASGLLASNLDRGARGFEKDAVAALHIAHTTLTGRDTTFSPLDQQGDYQRFSTSSAATPLAQPARAKRVYFPSKGGLEPAWFVELLLAGGVAHSYVVSAITGKLLFSNDLVRYDAFSYRVWASPDTKRIMDGPQGNDAVPLVVPTRNGFKPTFIPQSLVTLQNFPFSKNDPWLPAGATETTGNNVHAYSDVVMPDGFTASSADTVAQTTSASTFDYEDDLTVSAGTNPTVVKAAITQMFYTTNLLHDWYYDSGFDEKSGNHQDDNLGRGGIGGDPLHAETQDYSGRNNANASTPADGASPVIQMYLFGGPTNASLIVDAPSPAAGTKLVGVAGQFGKDSFALPGTVVVASDGGGVDAADACEAITTPLTGKIALVHRGNCSFVVKAQMVQAAGAAGVIIVNVPTSAQPTTAPFMGGTALGVTIAALSLNLADGQALEAAAAAGVTVTMKRDPSSDLDGALDGDIVSHEWGHVLSNRLIADGSGLETNQAGGLGEGWGDFSAMMVTVREDDALVPANASWAGVYPTAAFATGGDSEFYFGIRRVPYSTDMTKDPLTFKHISDGTPLPTDVPIAFGEDGSSNSEVHNTGEVWTTMLWECYASLLASGRFTFEQAQDRMKDYFVSSLKMTPPSPTLLEARDAVLAAAYANDAQDFAMFWKAFAKRGAGVGALGPPKDSPDNRGVTESFEVGNAASLVSLSLKDDVLTCDHDGIVDEGEIGTVRVTIRNSGAGTLAMTTATLSSKSPSLSFVDQPLVTFDAFKPFETKTANVKIYLDGTKDLSPVTIDIAVADPTFVKGGSLTIPLSTQHGVDEVAMSSTSDDVEPTQTAWVVTGMDVTGTSIKWHRIETGTNHSWFIPNAGEPADHRLTSPTFTVSDTAFVLAWRHRWSFEYSEMDMKDFDGGVVEITLDHGKTWDDLSKYAKMDYNTTLDDDPQTTMVLKGRPAYGHFSPGYPDKWVNSKIAVTLPAAQQTAMIRFRHGADDNTASVGWELDDLSLSGIDDKPFFSFVAQRDACDPAGPTAIAPPGQSTTPGASVSLVGAGTSPTNLPLGFSWRQSAGPAVVLNGRDTANLGFVAPATAEAVVLTFLLRANDGTLLSAPASVDVAVHPPSGADDGCGCHTVARSGDSRMAFGTGLLGLAVVLVRRRRRV